MSDLGDLVDQVRKGTLPPPAERRRIRRRAGVSLRSAAEVVGVSRQSILDWERGEVKPLLEHAIAYRELLRCSLSTRSRSGSRHPNRVQCGRRCCLRFRSGAGRDSSC